MQRNFALLAIAQFCQVTSTKYLDITRNVEECFEKNSGSASGCRGSTRGILGGGRSGANHPEPPDGARGQRAFYGVKGA